MKLHRKDFDIDKYNFYLLPTIRIVTNSVLYLSKNISLEFHFLFIHTRLLWLKAGELM